MKKRILLLVIISLPFVSIGQDVNNEIAMIQDMYGMEKRALVTQYMDLSDAQGAAFWEVYDQYEADRKELGRKRLLLINDYAENYLSLTEEKADQLATQVLANNIAYEKLHQSYYKKFKKATSALKAAQFMQLETFLQNAIRSEIQAEIPFIGEVEQMRKN